MDSLGISCPDFSSTLSPCMICIKFSVETVLDTRPRYHLFGHIHDAYGVEKGKSTIFSNASLLDEEYRLMNKPFVFEL